MLIAASFQSKHFLHSVIEQSLQVFKLKVCGWELPRESKKSQQERRSVDSSSSTEGLRSVRMSKISTDKVWPHSPEKGTIFLPKNLFSFFAKIPLKVPNEHSFCYASRQRKKRLSKFSVNSQESYDSHPLSVWNYLHFNKSLFHSKILCFKFCKWFLKK